MGELFNETPLHVAGISEGMSLYDDA